MFVFSYYSDFQSLYFLSFSEISLTKVNNRDYDVNKFNHTKYNDGDILVTRKSKES